MNEFEYCYEVKEDGTIRLLRVFGNVSMIEIPSSIDHRIVSEIGEYCFSRTNKKGFKSKHLLEIAGENVESISLPSTITKINSFAFYNCRKCFEIKFFNPVMEIGSDVFLNCNSLHSISMMCNHDTITSLKLILKQINWQVDVHFLDAVLSFPEYYENYNVIGPAHIFGMNISGEGYRARQCFKNNQFMIHEYDDVFSKLCIEESKKVLCHFALNRFLFPCDCNEHHLQQYIDYIQRNSLDTSLPILLDDEINKENKIWILNKLIHYMDVSCLNQLIEKASELDMIEISTYLIQWKKEYFTVKNTYNFEDF